jgi:hypothetical protein
METSGIKKSFQDFYDLDSAIITPTKDTVLGSYSICVYMSYMYIRILYAKE